VNRVGDGGGCEAAVGAEVLITPATGTMELRIADAWRGRTIESGRMYGGPLDVKESERRCGSPVVTVARIIRLIINLRWSDKGASGRTIVSGGKVHSRQASPDLR
jgi:hypothetical protein